MKAISSIPRNLIANADTLKVREALFMLYHFCENEPRLREKIISELRKIGFPLNLETIEREIRNMVKDGFMTYDEVKRKEKGGGSKPRAYYLSQRGKIKAEVVIKKLLGKLQVPES